MTTAISRFKLQIQLLEKFERFKLKTMAKQNHGTDMRPDGYYWVKYQGQWMVAFWEKTARGRGWWVMPGDRQEKTDEEITQIIEPALMEPRN